MAKRELSHFNRHTQASVRGLAQRTEIDLLDHVMILRYLDKVRLEPWWVGLLAFVGYYVVPMLFAAAEGVLMSPAFARKQLGAVGLDALVERISRAIPAPTHYYLFDVTHLLMSLVTVLLGGGFAYAALVRFGPVYTEVRAQLVELAPTVAQAEMDWLRRKTDSVFAKFGLLIVAAGCAAFLMARIRGGAATGWWLSAHYGPAGLVFAVAVFGMCLIGGHAVYVLAMGLHSIARHFHYPAKVRPFHHDGCNGFGKFGNYLMLLLCLCVLVGAAMWITFHRGYLGVEDFAGVWILGVLLLVLVPMIFLEPLFRATARIGEAQGRRLSRVEGALNRSLVALEESLDQGDAKAPLDQFKSLEDLHEVAGKVYAANVFPFNPRFAGALGVGYLIQVVGVVSEVVGKLQALEKLAR